MERGNGMRRLFAGTIVLIAVMQGAPPLQAAYHTYVFPQFVDGPFADDIQYRSTIIIAATQPADSTECDLRMYASGSIPMDGAAIRGSLDVINFTLPPGGWEISHSAGSEFNHGYVTITCNWPVQVQMLMSFLVGGLTRSETIVFPAEGSPAVEFLVDETESLLALAIANDCDCSNEYNFIALDPQSNIVAVQTVFAPPMTSFALFARELIPKLPENFQGRLLITSTDNIYVMGLQYSGLTYASIMPSREYD